MHTNYLYNNRQVCLGQSANIFGPKNVKKWIEMGNLDILMIFDELKWIYARFMTRQSVPITLCDQVQYKKTS